MFFLWHMQGAHEISTWNLENGLFKCMFAFPLQLPLIKGEKGHMLTVLFYQFGSVSDHLILLQNERVLQEHSRSILATAAGEATAAAPQGCCQG